MVIDELRQIQAQHGYLPADALGALAQRIQVPLYQLHGVASFYPHFRLTPPPAVDVVVCADMACHLRGADDLSEILQSRFGQPAANGVVVRPISCLGQCDRAPAAAVNDTVVTSVTADSLTTVVENAVAGVLPSHAHPAPVSGRLRIDPYEPADRYQALKALVTSGDVAGVMSTLKASELRGLGGAGFATGMKWEMVRGAPGEEKYVVCNADESEPGTIKDRFLMEQVPHLVIEGMVIAGLVTGARRGIIYLRHEYENPRAALERELAVAQRLGVIGRSVLGSAHAFELSIFISPGGYICGEESALLEALEGKRAEPRNKPPFPALQGLWQKPTVINNVETFANVPAILQRGVEWFKSQGRPGTPGLKFVGVSGHVVHPGVYEIAMGTPARSVIFEAAGGILGGRALKAWAPSGPSSGYLPASMVDVPLDFKSLQQAGSMLGSGAIVVCAEGTCMLDMALNAVRFFKNESCGKCVPCRVGTAKMVEILHGIARGRGRAADLALIGELSEAMALTSICGLGQIAPAPIRSVITHFREEIEDHVLRAHCPAGVCPVEPPTGRRV